MAQVRSFLGQPWPKIRLAMLRQVALPFVGFFPNAKRALRGSLEEPVSFV
jgi:hypothetical protein